MTSRQAGRRISELSRGQQIRRGTSRRKSVARGSQWSAKEKRRLTQLAVSAAMFVLLVAAKLLLPGRMDAFAQRLSGMMERNINVEEVFSAVGRAFSEEGGVRQALGDAYQAVFHPENDHEIVATAGQMDAGTAAQPVSLNLQHLRQFVDGKGPCDGWMPQESVGAAPLAKKQDAPQTPEAQTQPESSAGAETANLSYILYSDDNLPANVSLEQSILNFDYCTPVSGTISSSFGYREHPVEGEEKFHYGVDLAADTGTSILCFANGTVTATGESSSYGKYLIVAHKGEYATLYAHCSRITAVSGSEVREGQKIAEVGETGMATGPHLHFELHQGECYLNPIYYVQQA